jgi:uncharacterized protein YjbI with pentapeptide repeats
LVWWVLSVNTQPFFDGTDPAEDLRNLLWSLSFIGGALAAIIALINALRRTRMMRREQDSEIFAKAVEQLGHQSREVRLGAIYALESLMRLDFRSPARDGMMGRQIGETLAAYVRERSRVESRGQPSTEETSERHSDRLWIDIEAAVSALSRSWPFDIRTNSFSEPGIDLSGAQLQALRLPKHTDLRGINFSGANLSRAKLKGASFFGSYFVEANLDEAELVEANFDFADLAGASLRRAFLFKTSFRKARLSSARLDNANLSFANLECAILIETKMNNADLCGANLEFAALSDLVLDGAAVLDTRFAWTGALPLSHVTPNLFAQARWDPSAPPVVNPAMKIDWEFPHRGDGKPIDDPSPFETGWFNHVGRGG